MRVISLSFLVALREHNCTRQIQRKLQFELGHFR
jgi:hypothetical protein